MKQRELVSSLSGIALPFLSIPCHDCFGVLKQLKWSLLKRMFFEVLDENDELGFHKLRGLDLSPRMQCAVKMASQSGLTRGEGSFSMRNAKTQGKRFYFCDNPRERYVEFLGDEQEDRP